MIKGRNRTRTYGILQYTLFVIFILIVLMLIQNSIIKTTYYTYSTPKIQNSFRIVQLTDLHSREFGKNNARLIRKIKKQDPDIIFMTGDMVTNTDTSHEVITELVKEAIKIAPVYYSMGNHENGYKNHDALKSDLEAAGAHVLVDKYEDVEVNGNTIRIMGAYAFIGAHFEEEVLWVEKDFEKTDNLKIILSHVPSRFVHQEDDWWEYDMVFSGHFHGGQVRIPFIGGVRTPEGWFPKYDMGEYKKRDYTVFISSGLGNEKLIPRINNPPEIGVVDVNMMR